MSTEQARAKVFLLDCGRTLDRIDYYQDAFKFLAERGINRVIWHFCDDQGCRIRLKSVPGIGSESAFSVHETRHLVAFARKLGITLIPEIASLGHSRYITGLPRYRHLNENDGPYSGMSPVAPQTREVIAAITRETLDIFDSPEIHVGLDEVEIGQHPLTREALRTQSQTQLVADYIRFMHDLVVTEGGRTMWMWGDGLLAAPEMLELIPKDIIACNWQYRPTASTSSTQQLLDAGFNVITASALLSHDQTLFPSRDYAIKNVRVMQSHQALRGSTTPARVLGEMVTTWFPCRTLSEAQWLGWHLATHILQHGADSPLEPAIRSFGRDFYGLEQTEAWLNVCEILLDHSPMRTEWIGVIKLDIDALPAGDLESLAEKSVCWQTAAQRLRVISFDVRFNRAAFNTFLLMIDLLAHAYEAAAHLSSGLFDETFEQNLLRRREELFDQLSDAWDQERFADDPAKSNAVIDFFRDDHLLLVVRDGLNVLQKRIATVSAAPLYIA